MQNGNAYDEGIDNDFWKPVKAYWNDPTSKEKRDALRGLLTYEATKWQYFTGVKEPELISPDGPAHDQFLLDRKGNDEVQLDLFLSYGSNPPLYPGWQEYFRKHQPPMLIAWGKNDQIFPAAGAEPYKRDLKTLEFHLLDAGHFALESNGDEIAQLMLAFLGKHVEKK
ncbi:MAG: alpha/beta hydrolase [Pirellulales bacterium]